MKKKCIRFIMVFLVAFILFHSFSAYAAPEKLPLDTDTANEEDFLVG